MVYTFCSLDEAFPDPYSNLTKGRTIASPPSSIEGSLSGGNVSGRMGANPSPSAYPGTSSNAAPIPKATPPPRPYPDTQTSVEYDAIMAEPTKDIHIPSLATTSPSEATPASVSEKDFKPQLFNLVGSSHPPVPLERNASMINLGPTGTFQLPVSMYSPEGPKLNLGGETPIHQLKQQVKENFVNPGEMNMPQTKQEWEELLNKLEKYGQMKGWKRNSSNMEWQLWLQDMIPYILLGVFVVFILEGAIKLGGVLAKRK